MQQRPGFAGHFQWRHVMGRGQIAKALAPAHQRHLLHRQMRHLFVMAVAPEQADPHAAGNRRARRAWRRIKVIACAVKHRKTLNQAFARRIGGLIQTFGGIHIDQRCKKPFRAFGIQTRAEIAQRPRCLAAGKYHRFIGVHGQHPAAFQIGVGNLVMPFHPIAAVAIILAGLQNGHIGLTGEIRDGVII